MYHVMAHFVFYLNVNMNWFHYLNRLWDMYDSDEEKHTHTLKRILLGLMAHVIIHSFIHSIALRKIEHIYSKWDLFENWTSTETVHFRFCGKKRENIIKNKVKRKFTGDTTKKLTPSQGKKAQHTNNTKALLLPWVKSVSVFRTYAIGYIFDLIKTLSVGLTMYIAEMLRRILNIE